MNRLLILLLFPLLMLSCGKGPETITVNSDPLLPTENDTSFTQGPEEQASKDFIHYRFGEFETIHSLDPLFVSNNSEMRLVNLIYDGLIGLNSLGNPVPAIAKRWEVNIDSTRFTLHLKTNVFFHDSNVFNSGIGRKATVNDIKYVFERMASAQVPDQAYEMFKNIRGFSAYHNEQTFVKDPSKRVIKSINGIEVRNDSTILFIMNKPSGNFIKNLAHPYASIYPRESVNAGQVPIQRPAGTGEFYLVKREQNRFILSINKEYAGERPNLNRLDIIAGLSERDVFQEFTTENLDALIQLSPSTIETVLDSEGELVAGYQDRYTLLNTGIIPEYNLYYNPESNKAGDVASLLNTLQTNGSITQPGLGTFSFHLAGLEDSTITRGNNQFTITHTTSVPELYMVNRIAGKASTHGYTTAMNASYALSDEVSFSTQPYPGTIKVISWKVPLYVLMQPDVSGIRFSEYAWNINLSRLSRTGPGGS